MFKAERLHRIKEIIFERKQIDVATLSTLLNVTEVTIRNDLEQLEKAASSPLPRRSHLKYRGISRTAVPVRAHGQPCHPLR